MMRQWWIHRGFDLLVWLGAAFLSHLVLIFLGHLAISLATGHLPAEAQYFESRLWRPFVGIMAVVLAYLAGLIGLVGLTGRFRRAIGLFFGPVALIIMIQWAPDPLLIALSLAVPFIVASLTADYRTKPSLT